MKTPVLIAQGNQLLRQGLRSLINALADFTVVGDCEDGKQAVRLAVALSPALVLMDLSLPGLNGLEAAAQIKRRLPQVRVAILSCYRTPEYVRQALRAGVDGYVLEDASYDGLVTALRSVAAGKKYLSPELSDHLAEDDPSATSSKAASGDRLTARERSVWKLIAEGRTNRAAAALLQVSPKTVEKHRANLMSKLRLRNVAELTQFAWQCGLIEQSGIGSQPSSQVLPEHPDAIPRQAPALGL